MKRKTEIVHNDLIVDTVQDTLNLKEGDVFYFSIRGTTPRSRREYKLAVSQFKDSFLEEVLNEIDKTANAYHIKQFVVKNITKSYQKSYHLSVTNPTIEWVETITVEEV